MPSIPILLDERSAVSANPAHDVHGPFLIGLFFNTILFGVMLVQAYMYLAVPQRDSAWIRYFIIYLVSLDVLNSISVFYFSYHALINHFGDDAVVLETNWGFGLDPFLVALISFSTQGFFAWRIYTLTKSKAFVVIVVIFAIANLVGGAITGIKMMHGPFKYLLELRIPICIWLSSSAAADILITGYLTKYLQSQKSGFSRTDKLINRVIATTLQTGLITTVVALIDLALYLATPLGYHLIFNLPLAKLYSSSLLSSLNARTRWKFESSGLACSMNELRSTGLGIQNMANGGIDTRATTSEIFVNVGPLHMADESDQPYHLQGSKQFDHATTKIPSDDQKDRRREEGNRGEQMFVKSDPL